MKSTKICSLLLLLCAAALGQTVLAPMPRQCYPDSLSNGKPLAFGKIYSCSGGTSCPGNPLATYTDSTGLTQNPNPIILDGGGCASIWLTGGVAYKFVAQNSLGAQEWVTDNFFGLATSAATSQQNSTTVTFSATPTFTALAANQLFKITLTGNVTGSTLVMTGISAPALVTFEISQDGTGFRTFSWPLSVIGAATINSAANSVTTEHFFWDGTSLYPAFGYGALPAFPDGSIWNTLGLAFNGNTAITSGPPFAALTNRGWKFCIYSSTFCQGVASSTEYHAVGLGTGVNNWFSIGNTAANNDATASTPDSAAGISLGSNGQIVGPGGSTPITIKPSLTIGSLGPGSNGQCVITSGGASTWGSCSGSLATTVLTNNKTTGCGPVGNSLSNCVSLPIPANSTYDVHCWGSWESSTTNTGNSFIGLRGSTTGDTIQGDTRIWTDLVGSSVDNPGSVTGTSLLSTQAGPNTANTPYSFTTDGIIVTNGNAQTLSLAIEGTLTQGQITVPFAYCIAYSD